MQGLNTAAIIESHKDNVQVIFDKFNISAPVTKANLDNAIKAVPSIKNIIQNVFSGFEGNKEGEDNDFTIEFDALTGEEKKVKRKKILKDVFGFAKDTASTYIKTRQGAPSEQIQTEQIKDEPKKESKIFGMSKSLFIGICIVLFLIIVAVIVKQVKK